MRIEDVQVGHTVIPRVGWFARGNYPFTRMREDLVGNLCTVQEVDSEKGEVFIFTASVPPGYSWWPVEYCDLAPTPNTLPIDARVSVSRPDQSNATQLLVQLHDREKSDLRHRLDNAVKEAEAAERALTAARSEAATEAKVLRSQITALEKQVADLKSERDRVGKASQAGTRFAQLELD